MKILKSLIVALVLYPTGLYCQCDSLLFPEFDILLDSVSFYYNSDYARSMAFAEKGVKLMERANCPSDCIYAYNTASRLAAHHTDLKTSKHYINLLDSAFILEKDKLSKDDYVALYSTFLVDKGNYLYKLGEFDRATEVFLVLNDFSEENGEFGLSYLLSSYLYLGAIHKRQGNYSKALEYYNSSFNYSDLLGGNRKGLIYKHLGDVQRTLSFREEKSTTHQQEALRLYKLSYQILKQNAVAPNAPKTAINRWLSASEALADIYTDMTIFDSARVYLKESLDFQIQQNKQFYRTLDRLGELYMAEQNFPKARTTVLKSITIKREIFGDDNFYLANSYSALARQDLAGKNYESALKNVQKSLICLVDDFVDEDPTVNPKLRNVSSRLELLKVLNLKSEILIQQFAKEKDGSVIQLAELTNSLSLALVDSMRVDFDAEEDKINLIELSYPIFQNAIEIAQLNGGEVEQRVYAIIEQSKAVVLKEAFKRSKIREFDIPEAILEEESQLKFKISYLKDMIFREQNRKVPRESEIGNFSRELLAESNRYRELQMTLAKQYPAYHQLVYGLDFTPLEDVQNAMTSTQVMLEYFIGDAFIYRLDITKSKVELTTIPKDFDLNGWVRNFLDGIYYCKTQFDATEEDCRQAEANYVRFGHLIYKKLLPDFKSNYPDISQLTVIPDGVLGYLPFDALLDGEVKDAELKEYHNYPYLVRTKSVNYSYSASLYLEMLQKESGLESKKNLLAYAPSFGVEKQGDLRSLNSRLLFSKLLYNVKEVEALEQLVGGNMRTGRAATKEQFLKEANDFRIIHLSSHGKIDDREANYSFISFSQMDTIIDESQLLYLRELYNEKINADMVVLSACETGVGSSYRGEGMVSLARGFSFAGTKSIVTTLWQVDDKSTAQFMGHFYSELLNDKLKDESLRLAKMQFIDAKHPIYAHPFYWAGFIPIGNMEAIALSESTSLVWYVLSGLVLLIVGWFVLRRFG